MKKLIVIIMVCFFLKAEGQQKAKFNLQSMTTVILFDSTKQTRLVNRQDQVHFYEQWFLINKYNPTCNIMEDFNDVLYSFSDTLLPSEISYSTGSYDITLPTAVIHNANNYTERNLIAGNYIFQYDLSVDSVILPYNYGDIMYIYNRSTKKEVLEINVATLGGWYEQLPSAAGTSFGNGYWKIIVK